MEYADEKKAIEEFDSAANAPSGQAFEKPTNMRAHLDQLEQRISLLESKIEVINKGLIETQRAIGKEWKSPGAPPISG